MKILPFLLIALLPCGAHAASKPVATMVPGPSLSLLQVSLSLVIVLLAIFMVAWLARRYVPGNAPAGIVRIIGGVHLGNRERVVVLEIGEQWVMVGVTASQISALATVPRQDIATPASTNAFSGHLMERLSRWKKDHDAS